MTELSLFDSQLAVVVKNEEPGSADQSVLALQKTMSLAGWEVDYLDIDLTSPRPVATIKCHRADGRWLWAKVDSLGRCSLETFQRETWLGTPRNTKGRWPQSPQLDDVFLGRTRPEGARALLLHMTNYIADNALYSVALSDIRTAWDAVTHRPLRMVAQQDQD